MQQTKYSPSPYEILHIQNPQIAHSIDLITNPSSCECPQLSEKIPTEIKNLLPTPLNQKQISRINAVFTTDLAEIEKLCTKANSKPYKAVHLNKQQTKLGFGIEYTSEGIYGLLKVTIGTGKFKKISLAYNYSNQKLYAHSIVRSLYEVTLYDLMEEFKIQKSLDSPYIVKMHHYSKYKASKTSEYKLGFMMDYFSLGDYGNYLVKPSFFSEKWTKLSSKEIYTTVKDILSGLLNLEEAQIHHRDIKPENILISESKKGKLRAQLADFGFAKKIEDEKNMNHRCGSISYLSPEYIKGCRLIEISSEKEDNENLVKGREMSATTKTDIWALGVILYYIFEGSYFLTAYSMPRDVYNYLSNMTQKTIDDQFKNYDLTTNHFASFVHSLLNPDPNKRPSAKEALDQWKSIKNDILKWDHHIT